MAGSRSIFRRRAVVVTTAITPYYGVAKTRTVANKNSAFILSLPTRGPTADRLNPSFTLNAVSSTDTMYYAYPVSYGMATFTDVQANFQGGWDGAHGNFGSTLGPIIVPVTINGTSVNFYLYETDYPQLGIIEWKVT